MQETAIALLVVGVGLTFYHVAYWETNIRLAGDLRRRRVVLASHVVLLRDLNDELIGDLEEKIEDDELSDDIEIYRSEEKPPHSRILDGDEIDFNSWRAK